MHKFIKQKTKSGKCLSNRFYTNQHLIKSNNKKHQSHVWNLFKVINKDTRTAFDWNFSRARVYILKHAVNYWEVLFT